MKHIRFIPVLVAFTFLISLTSFAAAWQSNEQGWWYLHDDGTYPVSTWEWIDGNDDGIAECYYFDANGYCLMNTQAPDGSYVDANGAWIENGVVQSIILMDKSMRTTYPSNLPISIGTTLNDTITMFNQYGIEYYSNPIMSNSFYYYDNDGFYNYYYFNASGICYGGGRIFYTQNKDFADEILKQIVNDIELTLVSHTNTDEEITYTFQSDDKLTVITLNAWPNYEIGLYGVQFDYEYFG
jgi:type II secretory pathway pseudopilin PulG